jgi:hypothetical protein
MAIPLMGYILAWIFPIIDTHRDPDVNVNHTVSREKEIELERARENMPEVTDIENVEGRTKSVVMSGHA